MFLEMSITVKNFEGGTEPLDQVLAYLEVYIHTAHRDEKSTIFCSDKT